MKRNVLMSLGVIVGLGLLVSMSFIGMSHATDARSGDKPALASGDVTDNSLYIAGNEVTVAGTVKGDVYCAGQSVDISGTVEGDVICAGQTVRISGTVMGDARIAGQEVDISGTIAGSATAVGGNIRISKEGSIGRDLTLTSSAAMIEGSVGRDILGGAEAVRIASHVGRNVDGDISKLFIDAHAHIAGNLTYQGGKQATIVEGAVIAGETKYTPTQDNGPSNEAMSRAWGAFYGFIAMFIIGFAAIVTAPRAFDATALAVRKRPVASFAGGAAAILIMPALTILLFASLFGLPLAVIVFLTLAIGLIASLAVTSYGIGWLVVEKLGWPSRGRRLTSLVIGLLITFVLSIIPFIGGFILLFGLIVGLGAITVVITNRLFPKKGKQAKK